LSIHRIRIPEVVIPGKRLGRHIHIDDRSDAYPAETAAQLVSVTHRSAGLPLNQQETSSCTAHAVCGALNAIPHWAAGQPTLGEPDCYAVYSDEEVLEGFGPYPPNDQGGSGTEVCQAAKNRGWIFEYQHAADIHSALLAVVPRPAIFGMNWFTSFDSPDANGYIEIAPGATVRGGHEVCAIGLDAQNERIWFVNSWGTEYGVAHGDIPGGCFCMSFNTLAALFDQGADCTVPRTLKGWVASPLN
jgi:hypothetical protein